MLYNIQKQLKEAEKDTNTCEVLQIEGTEPLSQAYIINRLFFIFFSIVFIQDIVVSVKKFTAFQTSPV